MFESPKSGDGVRTRNVVCVLKPTTALFSIYSDFKKLRTRSGGSHTFFSNEYLDGLSGTRVRKDTFVMGAREACIT